VALSTLYVRSLLSLGESGVLYPSFWDHTPLSISKHTHTPLREGGGRARVNSEQAFSRLPV